jgi:hypothetical protein
VRRLVQERPFWHRHCARHPVARTASRRRAPANTNSFAYLNSLVNYLIHFSFAAGPFGSVCIGPVARPVAAARKVAAPNTESNPMRGVPTNIVGIPALQMFVARVPSRLLLSGLT